MVRIVTGVAAWSEPIEAESDDEDEDEDEGWRIVVKKRRRDWREQTEGGGGGGRNGGIDLGDTQPKDEQVVLLLMRLVALSVAYRRMIKEKTTVYVGEGSDNFLYKTNPRKVKGLRIVRIRSITFFFYAAR